MLRTSRLLVLGLFALAGACGDDDGPTGDGGTGGDGGRGADGGGRDGSTGADGGIAAAFDEIATQVAAAVCARYFRCCDAAERAAELDLPGTTEEACRAGFDNDLRSELDEVLPAITAGRTRFESTAVAGCLASLAPQACDVDPEDGDAACDAMFVGLVANGQTCSRSSECASGACAGLGNGDPGTCAPAPTAGQDCISFECGAGHVCDAMNKCVTTPTVGQACDLECAAGLTCVAGTCQTAKAAGAACAVADECASDDCISGTCVDLCVRQ